MVSFETSKILGEIGAILMLLIPFAGAYTTAIGFIGLILLIIAFYGLAGYYSERRIFNNALIGGILFIVGAVVAVAIVITAAVGILSVFGFQMSNWSNPTYWQNFNFQGFTNWTELAPFIGAMLGAVFIFWVLSIVAAYLARSSFITLAQKSGTGMFATSGLLLLIGAITTVILIGFLLIWIAIILLAVAFFRLRSASSIATNVPGTST